MSANDPKPPIHYAKQWILGLFAAIDRPDYDVHPVVSMVGEVIGPCPSGSCEMTAQGHRESA